ncbi:MAG: hypothetical protein MZU97_11025 [Bacillus subtilis]|nr:hypothetical protein [Bacillus subtilis]
MAPPPRSTPSRSETSLASLTNDATRRLPEKHPVSAVFAGLGGIAGPLDVERYIRRPPDRCPSFPQGARVGADSDVSNALASGNGTLEGMALIVGTGSVCFGVHDGKSWRAGGYHYKEGDAGSGFDLGFMALKHYARVIDGRHPEKRLQRGASRPPSGSTISRPS